MTPYKIISLDSDAPDTTVDLEHIVAVHDAAVSEDEWCVTFAVFFMFRDKPLIFSADTTPGAARKLKRAVQDRVVDPLIAAWKRESKSHAG